MARPIAVRQAGRAYARAADVDEADRRGTLAASLALADQGITEDVTPTLTCLGGPCLSQRSRVRVTPTNRVRLPVFGAVFGRGAGSTIPVTATHTEYVDIFKAP